MSGPLTGIRVVDMTTMLSGPWAAMILADQGADVIKVEPPGAGDDTRSWGPPFAAGESAYYLGVNRNKRSITLNMAVKSGQEVLAGLIRKADVLVENLKAGHAGALGMRRLRRLADGRAAIAPRRLTRRWVMTSAARARARTGLQYPRPCPKRPRPTIFQPVR